VELIVGRWRPRERSPVTLEFFVANNPTVLAQGDGCRLQLRFRSLVKFLSLVGFCAGVGTIPVYFLLVLLLPLLENGKPIPTADLPVVILAILIAAPLTGFLSFALYAVFAFPLYKWLGNRTYRGDFELLKRNDTSNQ
jgi:hypothetical protein